MQQYFDIAWNFVMAYWPFIVSGILIITAYIFGLKKKGINVIARIHAAILAPILFVVSIFREKDANGQATGKGSYTRIIGMYVIYELIKMSWVKLANTTYEIPTIMVIMFMLTNGLYMFLEFYKAAGDHLDSIVDGLVAKLSNGLILPSGYTQPSTKAPAQS
jgi:hypothetical protein